MGGSCPPVGGGAATATAATAAIGIAAAGTTPAAAATAAGRGCGARAAGAATAAGAAARGDAVVAGALDELSLLDMHLEGAPDKAEQPAKTRAERAALLVVEWCIAVGRADAVEEPAEAVGHHRKSLSIGAEAGLRVGLVGAFRSLAKGLHSRAQSGGVMGGHARGASAGSSGWASLRNLGAGAAGGDSNNHSLGGAAGAGSGGADDEAGPLTLQTTFGAGRALQAAPLAPPSPPALGGLVAERRASLSHSPDHGAPGSPSSSFLSSPLSRSSSFSSSSMRSWFSGKVRVDAAERRRLLAECDLGRLVFALRWHPQYAVELLTVASVHLHAAALKALCALLLGKLLPEPASASASTSTGASASRSACSCASTGACACLTLAQSCSGPARDVIFWRVLCHEFGAQGRAPLRGNLPAGLLLSALVREPQCVAAIRSLLEHALASSSRDPEDMARKVLDVFLQAQLDLILPARFVLVCRQIALLAEQHGHGRVATVGGCFFVLRYMGPAMLELSPGPDTVRAVKLLQLLCNASAANAREEQDYDAAERRFLADNAASMRRIVDALCHGGSSSKSSSGGGGGSCGDGGSSDSHNSDETASVYTAHMVDGMHLAMSEKAILLDVERILARPPADGAAETLILSMSEVRVLAGCALLLAEVHGNERERGALRAIVAPVVRKLNAIIVPPGAPADEAAESAEGLVPVRPRTVRCPALSESLGFTRGLRLSADDVERAGGQTRSELAVEMRLLALRDGLRAQ